MTLWDDICAVQQEIPTSFNTIEQVLSAVQMGLTLFPIVGVDGAAARRGFLVKIAATLVHGIELMDAEIDAEAEAAQEADDEIPF